MRPTMPSQHDACVPVILIPDLTGMLHVAAERLRRDDEAIDYCLAWMTSAAMTSGADSAAFPIWLPALIRTGGPAMPHSVAARS